MALYKLLYLKKEYINFSLGINNLGFPPKLMVLSCLKICFSHHQIAAFCILCLYQAVDYQVASIFATAFIIFSSLN